MWGSVVKSPQQIYRNFETAEGVRRTVVAKVHALREGVPKFESAKHYDCLITLLPHFSDALVQ